MRVLDGAEVTRLLDMPSCIRAVEDAFRARGEGRPAPSATLGFPLTGGTLHVKVASLDLVRRYVVAKVNANIPTNPIERELPTIQGVLVLLDGTTGAPLAIMDSAAITTIRTAATTAVAASRLARADASTLTIIGCGVQARAHLSAICAVREVKGVFAVDVRADAAKDLRAFSMNAHGIPCMIPTSQREATRLSDIIVTCTPSDRAILFAEDLRPGAFVAAVGADNEHKQEIDPALLRSAVTIADDIEQCARTGDLHHALAAGVMQKTDVRGSLDQIVAGTCVGRARDDETIVFDSTGLAIEDVAVAALAYERVDITRQS
jgi:ornithine cyclodeaminase/alanine dehydrogenase-like protein (mu-crystallin family)